MSWHNRDFLATLEYVRSDQSNTKTFLVLPICEELKVPHDFLCLVTSQ